MDSELGSSAGLAGFRRFLLSCLGLVAGNLLAFAVYRWAFFSSFVRNAPAAVLAPTLLRGLRLDAALMAAEVAVLLELALLTRYLRYRITLLALWIFSALNLLTIAVNFFFFQERGQQVWEMLLANARRPSEVWAAVDPFVRRHVLLAVAALAVAAAVAAAAWRQSRSFHAQKLDLWKARRALAVVAALAALTLALLEPIPDQEKPSRLRIVITGSKYYMSSADYVVNQSVVNPPWDLLTLYGRLAQVPRRYRLEPGLALSLTRGLLLLPSSDARYPLLRTIRGDGSLHVRNVVLVQIEGLATTIVDHPTQDGPLMPYLTSLARRGLFFPNLYQSFCATEGAVFATAASLHRTYSTAESFSHFFPHEIDGQFGSLPRILGSHGYRHFFFEGFRQRTADFVSFMGNQGYEPYGYRRLAGRLGDRLPRESNALGIYDGPMMQQVADVLLSGATPWTAYVVTATSHSPWEIPASVPSSFPHAIWNVFRYVDSSIAGFVERLRRECPEFDQTLFVLVGDHTSSTFTDNLGERTRVPLILYSTELARQRARWTDRLSAAASHVDILPTVLSLLEGEHIYCGMGRNLLEEGGPAGVISSCHSESLYIRGGLVLRSTPLDERSQLFLLRDGSIDPRDVSAAHPKETAQLTNEFLALYETSDRLTREGRVFPARPGVP